MNRFLVLVVIFLAACNTSSVRQDAQSKIEVLPISLDRILEQKNFIFLAVGQIGTAQIPQYISETLAKTKNLEEVGIASSLMDVWVAVDSSLKNKEVRAFHKRAFPYPQQDSGSLLISKYILSTWGTAHPVYPFGIYAKSGMAWNFRKENLWDRLLGRLESYAPSKDKAMLKENLQALQSCKISDANLEKTKKTLESWVQRVQGKISWAPHRQVLQMFPQILQIEKQNCQNMAESIWKISAPLLQHKIVAIGEYEEVSRWQKEIPGAYNIAIFAGGGRAYLDPQTLNLEDLPSLKLNSPSMRMRYSYF